jgi:hypothetical protein
VDNTRQFKAVTSSTRRTRLEAHVQKTTLFCLQ